MIFIFTEGIIFFKLFVGYRGTRGYPTLREKTKINYGVRRIMAATRRSPSSCNDVKNHAPPLSIAILKHRESAHSTLDYLIAPQRPQVCCGTKKIKRNIKKRAGVTPALKLLPPVTSATGTSATGSSTTGVPSSGFASSGTASSTTVIRAWACLIDFERAAFQVLAI